MHHDARMTLAGINWLAVLLSIVVSFVIGFVWFGPKTFFPVWWRAMGRSLDDMRVEGPTPMPVVFGLTIVGIVIQAVTLAMVIGLQRSAGQDVGLVGGLVTGLVLGIGFAAASSLSHRMFAGLSLKVWAIEVGQDVVCLAAMGAVIGAWA